jgi:hypothetical protein
LVKKAAFFGKLFVAQAEACAVTGALIKTRRQGAVSCRSGAAP